MVPTAEPDLTEILLPSERLRHIVLDLLCRSASKNAAETAPPRPLPLPSRLSLFP